MRDDATGFLLKAGAAVPECADVAACWPRQRGAAARWRRDRELLKVAASARTQRTERAWERLRPSG